MSLYYFDASALVKYYVIEPGSMWVREIIDRFDLDTGEWVNMVSIAEVSLVEVPAALAVLARTGRIRQRDRDREYRHFMSDAVHRYSTIPVTTADFEVAAELTQQHPLKATMQCNWPSPYATGRCWPVTN
jgi:predicted nucleic acid-binding protein